MIAWTNAKLDAIGIAEELELASVRDDGAQRSPVTMWVVRTGDDLYVRSVDGSRVVPSIVAPAARAATFKLSPR